MDRTLAAFLLTTGPLSNEEAEFLAYFAREKRHKVTDYVRFKRIYSKYLSPAEDQAPRPLPADERDYPF